jgi:hypothetical protein
MANKPNPQIAVWGIRNKQGQKYFLLRESGKADVRVPIPDEVTIYEALRDLFQNYGPAAFTLMNDVGPSFGKNLRIAVLENLVTPSVEKQ